MLSENTIAFGGNGFELNQSSLLYERRTKKYYTKAYCAIFYYH